MSETTITTDGEPITLSKQGGMLYLSIPGTPHPSVIEIDPDDLGHALSILNEGDAP